MQMPRMSGFYTEKTNYSIDGPEIIETISNSNILELHEEITSFDTPAMPHQIGS